MDTNWAASLAIILKEYLDYDRETGVFTWLVDRTGGVKAGMKAGGLHNGYMRIKLGGVECLAHRLAWIYANGSIPENREIDHINGMKADNRLCNLRLATPMQQRANAKLNSDNTSGYRGVYWNKKRKKWRAHIQRDHLGYFATKDEAAAVYALAFNERFGEEYRRIA